MSQVGSTSWGFRATARPPLGLGDRGARLPDRSRRREARDEHLSEASAPRRRRYAPACPRGDRLPAVRAVRCTGVVSHQIGERASFAHCRPAAVTACARPVSRRPPLLSMEDLWEDCGFTSLRGPSRAGVLPLGQSFLPLRVRLLLSIARRSHNAYELLGPNGPQLAAKPVPSTRNAAHRASKRR